MQQEYSSEEKMWTKSFISLSLTQFLLFTVFYALMTTLPIYVIHNLNESESSGGLVVTFMLASAILVRPFSAKVLDILGKKTSLILSVIIFTITTYFYLWVNTFTPLLILRFIHGISFGILTTATSAIAANIVPKARRGAGMGYFAMAMNIAVVAGPFIGLTLLQYISFKQFFLTLSLLMSISVLFSFLVDTKEQRQKHVHESQSALSFKISDLIEPKAIPISVISGFVGLAYASVLSFVPVFAEEMGLETAASYFFLIYAIVMIIFRPTLGRMFDEQGAKVVLVPSLVIFAIGLAVLSFTTLSITLLVAAILLGLGYGSLLPGFQTLAVQNTSHERSGQAMSTFFIFYDLGIASGAFIWGIVISGSGFTAMYIIGAILVLITAYALYIMLSKQEKRIEKKQEAYH